ncbi:MAG: universal stress protein [Gammaproteobacteria bacterium]|nr:universal stress protein [Gammaproteobacteria bacterium]MDH5800246.1 universal stress protein [Gammaproteobacteria bacterium]
MKFSKILLASHGSDGAQAATRLAVEVCDAGGCVHHLYVVPKLWDGIMGDDWLNNGVSRDRFAGHIETQLGQEVDQHAQWVQEIVEAAGLQYESTFIYGDPEDCLLKVGQQISPELLVLGAPRPKGVSGLRSRLLTDKVMRALNVPMMIAPYPHES